MVNKPELGIFLLFCLLGLYWIQLKILPLSKITCYLKCTNYGHSNSSSRTGAPGLNEIRFTTLPRLSSLETKKYSLETDGRQDSNILERGWGRSNTDPVGAVHMTKRVLAARPQFFSLFLHRYTISLTPQAIQQGHTYYHTTFLLELNYLTQGPTASKWQSWDSNQHLFDSKIYVFNHYIILPSLTIKGLNVLFGHWGFVGHCGCYIPLFSLSNCMSLRMLLKDTGTWSL